MADIPTHLGLILDGNRRWAKAQGLPPFEGHRKGYDNLKTIAQAALDAGVQYVSAYVFSTENWNRAQEEVDYLMKLLLWVATSEVDDLHKKGIKIRFIGAEGKLSAEILSAIRLAEEKTKDNTKGTLALCLNYGGQTEIVDATAKLMRDGVKPDVITVEKFAEALYSPDIPPVDFIIRTSGEMRLSNFMLWRAAYAELYFTDTHWPAFSKDDLSTALAEYSTRQRRMGGS